MSAVEVRIENRLKSNLLLPTLLWTMFLTFTIIVFLSTLLVDIAPSFHVSIGTASAMMLVASIMGLITGLIMSALTIRFEHKYLLLIGIVFFVVGVLGLFFAPTFNLALLSQAFIGVGSSTIGILVFCLIGDLLPLEKRGFAVGLTISMAMFAWIIVAPLSGFIETIAGWRSVLTWFIFPIAIGGLILTLAVIPSKPHPNQSTEKSLYSEAFKRILLNKSAVACLVGTALVWIFNSVPVYTVSFYRIQFLVAPVTGGLFGAIAAVGGMLGGATGGRLVNRYGRKPLTVTAGLVAGAFAILITFVPNVWLSVASWVVSATSVGIMSAAFISLVLEQVPQFRGSMMSINDTFRAAGVIVGSTLGVVVLNPLNIQVANFQLLMVIYGSAGIVTALIVLLLVRDPTKSQLPNQSKA